MGTWPAANSRREDSHVAAVSYCGDAGRVSHATLTRCAKARLSPTSPPYISAIGLHHGLCPSLRHGLRLNLRPGLRECLRPSLHKGLRPGATKAFALARRRLAAGRNEGQQPGATKASSRARRRPLTKASSRARRRPCPGLGPWPGLWLGPWRNGYGSDSLTVVAHADTLTHALANARKARPCRTKPKAGPRNARRAKG